MTKKIEDGGPAFPLAVQPDFQFAENGMSLRDWFAGQAIPAIIERCGADHRLPHEHITDYFARKAYEVADAMLLARKTGEA
ncbi:hypothetical protein MNR02_06405 [Shinella sp. H4-D48]|uniref:hypothetical protein n=1 Tax=Shinella sp. H4-D48 TaxID=2925841 RepID=UPI001F53CE85|nr:hypothetical protein [Shinella sp. H4-D48]UNK39332.1 hypothetical protein MNR02_06405 [Shinella sp. H4-D48]